MLDNYVSVRGLLEKPIQIRPGSIDHRLYIREIIMIAMLLTSVGIRLGKGNLMSTSCEIFVDAAIVSRGSIPVGRDNARSENEYLQRAISSQIDDNSLARCRQV